MVAPSTDKGNQETRSGFSDGQKVFFGALTVEVTLSCTNGDANDAGEIAALEVTGEI